jgi:hypothetical protein
VGEPRDEADHHGDLESLRDIKGLPRHIVGLLLIRRLEGDHLGEIREIAGVLLVLGGVHARIVGHREDEPSPDIEEGRIDEGVQGHV